MPTYEIRTAKTERADIAVYENRLVEAPTEAEAIAIAEADGGELLSYKTGHTEWLGETVGPIEVTDVHVESYSEEEWMAEVARLAVPGSRAAHAFADGEGYSFTDAYYDGELTPQDAVDEANADTD